MDRSHHGRRLTSQAQTAAHRSHRLRCMLLRPTADRGHDASALTRLDFASAPHRDALLDRKTIGHPAKSGLDAIAPTSATQAQPVDGPAAAAVAQPSRRLAQAHPTGPGLTHIDGSPVQHLGTARGGEFASHEASRVPQKHKFANILLPDRKFYKFIIITIIIPTSHYSATRRERLRRRPCWRIYVPS